MRFEGAVWRKSSYSGAEGGQCIEVAVAEVVVGVRDSKNPTGGVLAVNKGQFALLISTIKAGRIG